MSILGSQDGASLPFPQEVPTPLPPPLQPRPVTLSGQPRDSVDRPRLVLVSGG
jgi:hypothetical protein